MERRIKIEEDELENVRQVLKDRGFTLDEISEKIGVNYRNCLYKGTSLSEESFRKLKNLYKDSIDFSTIYFIDGSGFHEKVKLDKDVYAAELVGFMLGDGCISAYSKEENNRIVSNYFICITLHKDELKIRDRAANLIEKVIGERPKTESPEDQNIVNLKLYGKKYVEIFEELGLEPGNKVENQVSVPSWVMENLNYQKSCLRGLIDTDGSIYKRGKYYIVNFKNRSKPLLKDFESICSNLGFSPSKSGKYDRQIAQQAEVREFINKIRPIKSENISLA